jgi:hypothetical protein
MSLAFGIRQQDTQSTSAISVSINTITSTVADLTYKNSTLTYDTAGSFSTTIPSGATIMVIECYGGGGTGEGLVVAGTGGGGAGGQYAKKTINSPTSGQTVNITVAASRIGINGLGRNGNDSYVSVNSIEECRAKGGAGGRSTGANGSTSGGVGDTVNAGGNGAAASSDGGGGGGCGGTSGAGGNASGITAGTGGGGNAGSGGNGASGSGGTSDGISGYPYGGAGGGGFVLTSGSANGGNGGQGFVKIIFYLS